MTFNYDIAFDMALYKAKITPDYGINELPKNRKSIPLYKLHGSLNWATAIDEREIKPLYLEDYFKSYEPVTSLYGIILPKNWAHS